MPTRSAVALTVYEALEAATGSPLAVGAAANGDRGTRRLSEMSQLCVCTVFDQDSRGFMYDTEDRAFMGKTPRIREAKSASMDHVFLTVATRLKEARLRLKMTQKQVADLLGMPQSYLFEIESGRTNITLRTFIRLAEVLQTDLRALLPEPGPGLASPDDVSIFRAILDKAVAVLADHETKDAERHEQDTERHRRNAERHKQDAERYREDGERLREDAERQKRQSALLRELKSFAALQKFAEMATPPMRELPPVKELGPEADTRGVKRSGRPPSYH